MEENEDFEDFDEEVLKQIAHGHYLEDQDALLDDNENENENENDNENEKENEIGNENENENDNKKNDKKNKESNAEKNNVLFADYLL